MKTKSFPPQLLKFTRACGSHVSTAVFLMIFLALCSSPCALSQIPQGFNYQAIARDEATGNPITDPIDIKIAILSDDDPETVIWEELHSAVDPNDQGLFSIVVGQGSCLTTPTCFDDIDWSVSPLYIRTLIFYSGEWKNLGSAQLWSVPYAMQTASATPVDAVTLTGNQTIGGIKTFSNDILVNGLTSGRGSSSVSTNTALGVNALHSNSTGYFNVAIGCNALASNNIGFTNTANGYYALSSNTEGSYNSAGGSLALKNNTTAYKNTAFGHAALYSTSTGNGNTALGYGAGYSNSTGSGNVFLGQSAGYYETGSDKLFIDNQPRANEADARSKALIYAIFNADPANQILSINGSVGIGNASPSAKLHVTGATRIQGNLTVDNAIHVKSYPANGDIGVYNLEVGGPAPSATNGQATIFLHHHSTIAHQLRYTSGRLFFEAAGNGYGTNTTPSLQVNGGLYAAVNGGNVGIGTASATSKMVIQPPVDWDDSTPLFEVKNKSGVPVLAVYNNGVRVNVEHDPDGVKGPKGGFAIGGYDYTKGGTVTLMNVTPDSIRFNINNDNAKGPKGGFAIGGFDYTKGDINQDFMYITPQTSSSGKYNTYLGFETGKNSNGPHNTYIGVGAGKGLAGNNSASNIFIGEQAGLNNYGSYSYEARPRGDGTWIMVYTSYGGENVVVGNYSGMDISGSAILPNNGKSNVLIGNYSGNILNTGSRNVFLGFEAGFKEISGSGNIMIGYRAGYNETGSNKLYIDNSNISTPLIFGDFNTRILSFDGNIGIGTANPQAKLEINGANGDRLAVYSPIDNTLCMQTLLDGVGFSSYPYGGDQNRLILQAWVGIVGIGRVPASNKLEVDGEASKTTAGSWLANSDARIKTQIMEIEDAQENIMKLHPVKFRYSDEWKERNPSIQDKFYYNFIAQEFRNVFPESVKGSGEYLEGQPDEILQLDSYNAQVIAIKALQEVILQNREQERLIESQQKQIDELKSLVNNLMAGEK